MNMTHIITPTDVPLMHFSYTMIWKNPHQNWMENFFKNHILSKKKTFKYREYPLTYSMTKIKGKETLESKEQYKFSKPCEIKFFWPF